MSGFRRTVDRSPHDEAHLRSRSRRRRVRGCVGAGGAAGAARGGWARRWARRRTAGTVRARAEGREADRVRSAAQSRTPSCPKYWRSTKGSADWTEPVVDDDNLHADYISMGSGQEDAAPDERRHPRVVGDSGRPDSIHDRRAGTVRGVEGVPRAGAVSHDVHDGNRGRSAVAALRSEHREGAEDVSDGREASARCRFQLRSGARARQR